ncbi:MAG TPA: hypothetical protein PK318_08680, partial [Accumulibacter sp.]|nr:hypothetical protein [Accumulibacter sp.]HNE13435.1 hypothetical protein [Accumulibacter sp.]
TINLQIDEHGIRLDFSALNAELDRRLAANPLEGFGDRIDFNAASREMLADSGWEGWAKVDALLTRDPQREAFRSLLATEEAWVKGPAGFNRRGGAKKKENRLRQQRIRGDRTTRTGGHAGVRHREIRGNGAQACRVPVKRLISVNERGMGRL